MTRLAMETTRLTDVTLVQTEDDQIRDGHNEIDTFQTSVDRTCPKWYITYIP